MKVKFHKNRPDVLSLFYKSSEMANTIMLPVYMVVSDQPVSQAQITCDATHYDQPMKSLKHIWNMNLKPQRTLNIS